MKKISQTLTIADRPFTFETGELAPQAESAVYARYGDTVVLATVAVSKQDSDRGYFPLSVEFTEKLYAGGRIKGSRWVKREGRPSDDLVLKARLIDRSIRPLFPKAFKKDVQVIVTVLSVDRENDSDMVGMLAVSAALHLSSIPWNGPIASVRMGTANGNYVVNPTNAEMEFSDLDLVVSSSKEKVVMIEAGANQVSDERMFEAIKMAHEETKPIIALIEELRKKAGQKKQELPEKKDHKLFDAIRKSHKKEIVETLTARALKKEGSYEKHTQLINELSKAYEEAYTASDVMAVLDKVFEENMRETILKTGKRVDGRGLKDLRPLSGRVSVLPRTHGSAIFQRGDTQALTITTLAPPSLEMWLESAEGEETKRYMHHYNMPPFSVGETGRVGYPGRREIGHGALAERALEPVIPSEEDFPYTIHVVSEILSSNGSTSMASTCGSTLSLMDAGVPIKAPVGGISTGLVTEGEKYVLLTDIMGVEDFGGDMDFKVAGTREGITAIQLDIKIDGLTLPMIKDTFVQSHEARLKILDMMNTVIPATREAVSPHAPKVETVTIDVEKIGEVIGPSGRMIKSIIAETGCDINVEDDGVVTISGQDATKVQVAVDWIKGIVREVKEGEVFEGEVKRLMPFGAFVEILPGKEGLVHLSKMSTEFVEKPEDIVSVGQTVRVRVVEIDQHKRINLSMLFGEDAKSERHDRPDRGGRSGGYGRSPRDDRSRGGGGDRQGDRRGGQGRQRYQHPHLREDR
ncbi:MAG: polyribonucleotide nucleotidyltransferase [Candidatus Roizmanbacteria bacterium]|nr:polyribonucleotide nucleotidyltransferase [Candidatus Roizmanbacteria bacterium]